MTRQRTVRMGWLCGCAIGLAPALAATDELATSYAQQHTRYAQQYQVAQNTQPSRSAASSELDGQPDSAPVSAAPVPETPERILYRLPSRGSPRARVGGGTRTSGATLAVQALAPPHVALTMRSAPTLYWYIENVPPEAVRIEFTLLDEEGIEPVASVELPHPQAAGIQRLRLADHGIALEPDVDYEWSIALVPDPSKRSHDVVSTAWLRRIGAGDAAGPQTAGELAERSLWYDALAVLSDEIVADPTNQELRAMRGSLLRQGEMTVAIQ